MNYSRPVERYEEPLRDCPDLPACKPCGWVLIAVSVACIALWLGVVVFVVRRMW
jgi:hypothetical protein